jgi:hypothetical protein
MIILIKLSAKLLVSFIPANSFPRCTITPKESNSFNHHSYFSHHLSKVTNEIP